MKIDVTRRDVLRVGGGAAAGVMLTPAPWRLVDDLAIWTQNWSWIPVPPKGPVTVKNSVCTLCPAACAMKVRCVGNLPVSIQPANGSALCALGLTAHHLPYHPRRLETPVRIARGKREVVDLRSVVAAASDAIRANRGAVAVLDMRPGRAVSWAWRRFLAETPQGMYVPSPARDGASLAALEQMVNAEPATLAIDVAGAKTILAFGIPQGAKLEGKNLITVESALSEVPAARRSWIAARPGSEAVVALAIAHELFARNLVRPPDAVDLEEYRSIVAQVTPAAAASIAGVPAAQLEAAARELVQNGPCAVVIGDSAPLGHAAAAAILGLNVLLGSVSVTARKPLPPPESGATLAPVAELDSVPGRSVSLLIVDASSGDNALPWPLVERVLKSDALVVALSPYAAGTALHARFIVPTLAFLESWQDAGTPPHSMVASFSVAAPMMRARRAGIDPASFMRALGASTPATSEELMKARVAAIHAQGSGIVTSFADGSTKKIAELGSSGELWDALSAGGRWEDDPVPPPEPPLRVAMLAGARAEIEQLVATRREALNIHLRTPHDVSSTAAVSPALTKLYRESGLRRSPAVATVNPDTAKALRVRTGRNARLYTAAGAIDVTVATDRAVMPGVVEMSCAPDAAALGVPEAVPDPNVLDIWPVASGGWRSTAARLVEA